MSDTIAAIATANGIGALGVVRLSGPDSASIVEKFFKSNPPLTRLEPWHAVLGRITSFGPLPPTVDWAVAIKYEAPKSFTGEDMVEIMAHGSPFILRETLCLAFASGAREALPGEFTQRAFLNGKIDLVQAEAIAAMIRAQSTKAAHLQSEILSGALSKQLVEARGVLVEVLAEVDVVIDHPDEPEILQDFSGDGLSALIRKTQSQLQSLTRGFKNSYKLREGFSVVLVGAANAGKSSLFNGLLSKNKAIVSPLPGTTRDALEEFLELDGALVRLIDTAGFSEADDLLGREGRRRAEEAIVRADFVLLVIDGAKEDIREDMFLPPLLADKTTLVVWNKKDLPEFAAKTQVFNGNFHKMGEVATSAAQGVGFDDIRETLAQHIRTSLGNGEPSGFWEERQVILAQEAALCLDAALEKLGEEAWELAAFEIRASLRKIDTILGKGEITEDLLRKIFSKFCVGK